MANLRIGSAIQQTINVIGTQQSAAFFCPSGTELTVTCPSVGSTVIGGCTIDVTQANQQAIFAGTATWITAGAGTYTASSAQATKLPFDCFIRVNGTGSGASVFMDPQGATVPMPVPTFTLDANNTPIQPIGSNGQALAAYNAQVAASRSITPADFETVLSCASGITITIPNDSTLGITSTTYAPCVALLWSGASQFVVAAGSGVTLSGTPPSITQYGMLGLIRIAANTWAYV